MRKFLGFLIGLAFLSLAVGYTGEALLTGLEVERARAEEKAAHARADQALAEAVKVQAEALAAQARAEARASAEQARFYLVALIAVSAWAAVLVAVLVFVVVHLVRGQRAAELRYLPKQETQPGMLQPGNNQVALQDGYYLMQLAKPEYLERGR
jgi:uncharacterized membrane protein YgcG